LSFYLPPTPFSPPPSFNTNITLPFIFHLSSFSLSLPPPPLSTGPISHASRCCVLLLSKTIHEVCERRHCPHHRRGWWYREGITITTFRTSRCLA
jgi:hypothetical protein